MRAGDTKLNRDLAGSLELAGTLFKSSAMNLFSVSAVINFELLFPHLKMPTLQGTYEDEIDKKMK